MTCRAALACVCLFAFSPPAFSQAPSPQPEPIETIEPDRPDVTNGTHIVDIGLLQIEIGGLYTHPTAGQHAFGTPFTARIGLLDWFEGRIGTDGLLLQADDRGRVSGLGNLQLGAKLRLSGGARRNPCVVDPSHDQRADRERRQRTRFG